MATIAPLLDRSRLYILIAGLETDLRAILRQWVLSYKTEDDVFGGRYRLLRERAEEDGADPSGSVIDYADFADSFEIVNRHSAMVPGEVARAIKDYTPHLAAFIGPRNRVMHSRPLHEGDLEAGLKLCMGLLDQPLPLPTLRDLVTRIQEDPSWSPALDSSASSDAKVAHNLPFPEFDETGLLGRVNENRDLLERLRRRRDRVITLVGEGGMGKTALAVKTLDDLVYEPDCPYEAVLWASLKTERLTAEGVEAVGTAARDVLGIAAHLARPLDDTFHGTPEELGELLAGIEVLIAIDNVESTSADEIVRFYDAMPDSCWFLLTSRVGLGQLERRIPVGPLDCKSGAKMLRVLAARRGLTSLAQLSPQQLEAQVDRLRGTPLAIRWYVEAVSAGLPASVAIRDQSELLRFCLETIYGGLTEAARRCVTVLYAAQAGLDASQIAVASDLSADTLARALQDLQRRSLVEVQHAGAEGLYEKYKLTAATTRYLGSVDRPTDSVLKDAEKRLAELHASEERRQREAAGSAVSLYYFDVEEEEHKAIAHILRKALLASRKEPAEAEAQLQRAKGLAPDYHEVHRVEGVLATNAAQHARAHEAYERAYELAPDGTARARVAHFYSWLVAEQGDIQRALELETEAHNVLDLPATRTRVGQYLMYAKRFDEAEAMLRPVLGMDDLRSVLIAWTQLLSVTKRRVEDLRAARQAGDAVRVGARGLREISAYLDTGVTDSTLRSRALDLGLETLQAACDLQDWNGCEDDVAVILRYATRHANELLVHPDRSFWLRTSRRMRESRSCPTDVAESLAALEATLAVKEGHELLRGLVVGFDCAKGYGFIEQTHGTERVFFHRSDLRDRGVEVLLMKDTPVSFAVRREEKGLHASGVRPELAPEVETDVLRSRRGQVARKYDDYLFATDEHTKAPVFVGMHAMPAREWKHVAVGDLLRYDLELVPKGPRAVRGSARRIDRS